MCMRVLTGECVWAQSIVNHVKWKKSLIHPIENCVNIFSNFNHICLLNWKDCGGTHTTSKSKLIELINFRNDRDNANRPTSNQSPPTGYVILQEPIGDHEDASVTKRATPLSYGALNPMRGVARWRVSAQKREGDGVVFWRFLYFSTL